MPDAGYSSRSLAKAAKAGASQPKAKGGKSPAAKPGSAAAKGAKGNKTKRTPDPKRALDVSSA